MSDYSSLITDLAIENEKTTTEANALGRKRQKNITVYLAINNQMS